MGNFIRVEPDCNLLQSTFSLSIPFYSSLSTCTHAVAFMVYAVGFFSPIVIKNYGRYWLGVCFIEDLVFSYDS